MTINTYLKKKNIIINDLQKLNNNPELFFTNIEYLNSENFDIKDYDTMYIEGAIVIKNESATILGFSEWDLVDQLWSYFVEMIEEYFNRSKSSRYFPDQPINIVFKKMTDEYIIFSIDNNNFTFLRKEFFDVLLKSSKEFFNKMNELYLIDNLDQIKKIDNLLQRNSLI